MCAPCSARAQSEPSPSQALLALSGDAGLDFLSGLGWQPRGYGRERFAWSGPRGSGVPTSLLCIPRLFSPPLSCSVSPLLDWSIHLLVPHAGVPLCLHAWHSIPMCDTYDAVVLFFWNQPCSTLVMAAPQTSRLALWP